MAWCKDVCPVSTNGLAAVSSFFNSFFFLIPSRLIGKPHTLPNHFKHKFCFFRSKQNHFSDELAFKEIKAYGGLSLNRLLDIYYKSDDGKFCFFFLPITITC